MTDGRQLAVIVGCCAVTAAMLVLTITLPLDHARFVWLVGTPFGLVAAYLTRPRRPDLDRDSIRRHHAATRALRKVHR